jgi:TRAP-type C4-dicarboxylate transport system permease small subunit
LPTPVFIKEQTRTRESTNMEKFLNSLSDQLFKFAKYLLVFLGIEIVTIVCINVFSRYALDFSYYWAEEVTRYSFVWMTFFGAACAYKQRGLVSMSVLTHYFSKGVRWKVGLFVDLCITVFLLISFFFGTNLTMAVYRQTSAALSIPMTYVYICIPLSFAFMLVFNLAQVVKVINTRRPLGIWGEDW